MPVPEWGLAGRPLTGVQDATTHPPSTGSPAEPGVASPAEGLGRSELWLGPPSCAEQMSGAGAWAQPARPAVLPPTPT